MTEPRTTVVYEPDGIIKGVEFSTVFANLFEDLLLHYLTMYENKQEIAEAYKKIEQFVDGKEVQLNKLETHIYTLTATAQTLRRLALEQGVAKEVPISEEAVNKAKETAASFLQSVESKDALEDYNKKIVELNEVFKKELS